MRLWPENFRWTRPIRFVLIVLFGLFQSDAGRAQVIKDEFDFIEEWQLLSDRVKSGEVALNKSGLPPGFDTEVSKPSEKGLFKVSVAPSADPAPFNKIHGWQVRIETPDGQPVTGAELKFYGGMPLHNHGYPTEPRFTREIAPGVYALDGIKFSMSGWWTLAMGIVKEDARDRVGFNLIVQP